MWRNNNLGMVGKWGGFSFVVGVMITAFVFNGNNFSYAYTSETVIPINQQNELKLDFNSVGKINEITAPLNSFVNEALKAFRLNQSINIGTGVPLSPIKNPSQAIDFNKFFSSSKVSSNDLTSFLKEAAITGINLTILVISITSQVLKGILEAIK